MRPEKVVIILSPEGVHMEPELTLAQILIVSTELATAAILAAAEGESDPHEVASECVEWLHENVASNVYRNLSESEEEFRQ